MSSTGVMAPGDETCVGCGEKIPGVEVGTLWCRSEFGLTTLKTHKQQACGKAALAKTGYKMMKGNRPPKPRGKHGERADQGAGQQRLGEDQRGGAGEPAGG